MKLVHIDGNRIVNLDCVALATFKSEHEATRMVYSDIDGKEHPAKFTEPDTLTLVLMTQSDTGYQASEGLHIKVADDNARYLWSYLENRADIPNIENTEH